MKFHVTCFNLQKIGETVFDIGMALLELGSAMLFLLAFLALFPLGVFLDIAASALRVERYIEADLKRGLRK